MGVVLAAFGAGPGGKVSGGGAVAGDRDTGDWGVGIDRVPDAYATGFIGIAGGLAYLADQRGRRFR